MELLDYVNSHYREELRLSELAERFHLNPSYCSELFRKITHKSYSEYLAERRIEEARRLLDHTSLGLEQAAYQVGFKDYYYFSKVFKKITGLPPLRYRQRGAAGDGRGGTPC
jgi:two-component system response regulator YesN